jgi:hypothetical protein
MKKSRPTFLFALAAIAFSLVVFFTFKNVDPQSFLNNLTIQNVLLNLVIGVVYFSSFGLVMTVVFKRHYNVDFVKEDTFLLPFMMHIFSYIMPVQGGMLFQTFFMKMKYKMALTKGFSTGVYLFMASLILTCVGGLILSYFIDGVSEIRMVLYLMLIGLMGIMGTAVVTSGITIKGDTFFYKIIGFLHDIIAQVGELSKQPILFLKVMLIIGFSALIHAGWFYQTAIILGIEVSFSGMLLATLVFRIVMLIRILPGNLGIQELITSIVFLGAGLAIEEGLLIAVFNRAASVMLAAIIGLGGLYHNFRYFGTDGIQQLLNKMKGK